MSDINQIIQVNITRQTPVASLPGFGVPAILAQFAAGTKGFAGTTRTKYYGSTSEMTSDGWAATDSVYLAAQAIFSQNPRVPRVFVGRIDTADASVAASGDAIRAEQDDWYTFEVVGNRAIKFVLGSDLSTGNVLSSTINGTTVAPVTYATSHANTMSLWKTAIEAAITGATATISGREMTVTLVGKDLNIGTASVAGGTAVTVTISNPLDATKTKAWMAWAATQKKLQFVQDSDPATYAADTGSTSTACLAEFAKLMSYDRVAMVYHATNTEYAAAAWVGKGLPYDPGAHTWAFKSLTGVSVDSLTTAQEGLIRGKNANIYTNTASYANTYAGTVAKANNYIDDVRGLDWLDTTIKADLFNLLAASGKVPFTDSGIQMVVGTLKGSLRKAETATVLTSGWTVTFPAASVVPAADKAARKLTGITWTGTLAGAVHSIVINGTVSV